MEEEKGTSDINEAEKQELVAAGGGGDAVKSPKSYAFLVMLKAPGRHRRAGRHEVIATCEPQQPIVCVGAIMVMRNISHDLRHGDLWWRRSRRHVSNSQPQCDVQNR